MGCTGNTLQPGVVLWTRGGFNDVYLELDADTEDVRRVCLPESVLLGLAADHVRAHKECVLEEASDKAILGLE